MQIELTRELSTVLRYASEEALRTGHRAVSPDHLLLGMLRQNNNSGVSTLRQLGIDTELFKKALDLGIMKDIDIDPMPSTWEINPSVVFTVNCLLEGR